MAMSVLVLVCQACALTFRARKKDARYCSSKCYPSNKKVEEDSPVKGRFRGLESEYVVALDLIRRGFDLYWPVSAANKYDIIIEKDQKLLTVEIKTAWRTSPKTLGYPTVKYQTDILALVHNHTVITYLNGKNTAKFVDPEVLQAVTPL